MVQPKRLRMSARVRVSRERGSVVAGWVGHAYRNGKAGSATLWKRPTEVALLRFPGSLQNRSKSCYGQPDLSSVNHAMTVGADQCKVIHVSLLTLRKRGDGLRVMALDKPDAAITVDNRKIEAARFARQLSVLL